MRDIVILGTGGCARELQWLLEENNSLAENEQEKWNILGFVEPVAEPGVLVNDLPVYTDTWLLEQNGLAVACGLGEAQIRRKVVNSLLAKNPTLRFPTLISKQAQVGPRVEIGRGCIICAGVIVTCNIKIEEFVTINIGSVITHDVRIGAFTQINPSTNVSGGVRIGAGVQIGTGVKIIPKVKIGDNAILGAGAVVIKDIPENCTAVGCPAKVVHKADLGE